MKHVVFFSGGVASWAAARRVADEYGTDDLVLLFTDTLIEDPDLYRFLRQAADDVGGKLVREAEGRDPWGVFFDVRFLGNSRVDPCSRILKREIARKWVEANCDPGDTTLYLGLDWQEIRRCEPVQRNWHPYPVEFPMCGPPYQMKPDILADLRARGIAPPQLYDLGFPHNNCGGFCIKAGQAVFRLLFLHFPNRYALHEAKEQELRDHLEADVAILRDRRGGEVQPLTLKAFRERIQEDDQQCDLLDFGGCGCFSDVEEMAA